MPGNSPPESPLESPLESSPHNAPLTDRVAALTDLRQAYRDAQDGRPGVVLVTGEAGVGKTRLVAEVRDEAARTGGTVLPGQCLDLGEPGIPYLPVRDIMRAAAALPGADAALVQRLAPAPGAAAADDLARLQLFEGTTTLLAQLAMQQGPLLVVVEDLQWVDPSTADLLRFLLPRLPEAPLLVVLTARSEGLSRRSHARRAIGEATRLPGAIRIDLTPLDDAHTTEYVTDCADHFGRRLDAELAGRIVAQSGGNPFYAQALVRAVVAGHGLNPRGSAGDVLTDVVLGRIDPLSPAVRAVLRSLAVAGRPVTHDVLAQVVGLEEDTLRDALREALDQRLLVAADDRYAFAHGIVRQVVHDEMLPGERSELHAAYGAALELDPAAGPAEISHHYAASSDSANALTWTVRAGRDALRWPAPAEALEQLELALRLWPTVPEASARTGTTQSALAVEAARAAGLAGRPHRAVELARAAVAADQSGGTTAVLSRIELARDLLTLDQPEEAVVHARAAVDLGADPSSEPATAAQAMLARALLSARDPDAARPAAEAALAAAQRNGLAALQIDALTTLAFLDEIDGDRAAAAERLAGALRQARACGELAAELRVHYYLASLHYYNGDVAGSLPVLDVAVRRVDESGLRWSQSGVEIRILQVIARYVAGDLAGSLAAAAMSTATSPGKPPDVPAARLLAVSCYAAVARGDADAPERFEALRGAWDQDAQIGLVAGGCEADHLSWVGDPLGAAAIAERAQRFLDDMLGPGMYGGLWLSALALAALADDAAVCRRRRNTSGLAAAQRRGEALRERVERIAAAGYGRPGDLGPEGRAWAVRAAAEHARLGDTATSADWRQAVNAFGFGYRYEQARCRWRLAAFLLADGDRRGAEVEARAALADAAEMGAEPLRRAVQQFLESGRFDTGATGGPLTTRELEVLALVAEGLTNRQIGQRLYISEKTASVHLSNLMAKLGVSGRTEAVTVAARRGLLNVVQP